MLAGHFQEQGRAWLVRWRDAGGLGAWHESRLTDLGERRLDHALALLRYDSDRARTALPSFLESLDDPQLRAELLRALADSTDAAYAPLFLTAMAVEDAAAVEAAIGLAALGDERGRVRACALARRAPWNWPDVLVRLARAGAKDEAGRLLLELTTAHPGKDFEVGLAMFDDGFHGPDQALALARLLVREGRRGEDDALVDRLRALTGATGDWPIVEALCAWPAAFDARPDRAEHAAVTIASLGTGVVAEFESRGGPAVRPLLLAALRSEDLARIDALDDALGRAGSALVAWLDAACAPDDRPRLRGAVLRASLRVRGVDDEGNARGLWDLQFAPWRPEDLLAVVEAWRAQPDAAALELTLERAADLHGISLGARPLDAWTGALRAHVRAPGFEHDGDVNDLERLLRDLRRALERSPDAPASARIVVGR